MSSSQSAAAACVVAAAFGEQSKLAVSARAEFGGKAEIERLRTSNVGAIGIAATFEETARGQIDRGYPLRRGLHLERREVC